METTYVISVDTLDLSLLPSTYQYGSNMSPLWNRSDDLTEFSVSIGNNSPSEGSAPEESTPRSKAVETAICHMCKADVPKQFFKQHKDSPKHKTYTKIANIALQRITEHINDKCDCDETKIDSSTYFCSHCITVVKINERKSHDSSDIHKNAVFLDKCLSNFLDLYENFLKKDNNDKVIKTLEVPRSSKKNEIEENKFDLKNYFDILENEFKMSMKYKIIDDERLEFEIDGRKVELAAQNFHGIKTTSSDGLECVVCKEVVKDKVEHIMSVKHMHRASISFKDIHCKREIYPSWHHCVLCNVITDNSTSHTTSDPGHQRLLQEALKYKIHENSTEDSSISSENWTLVTNKTIKTEASTSKESSVNQYINLLDTDNNSVASKDDILSTVNKTFCSQCNVYIVTKNLKKHLSTKKHVGNSVSKYYYLFKIDVDRTSCKICDTVVELNDFEKHVNLSEHENNYNVLLAKNKVRKIDSTHLFCDVCDKLVLVKNELYHVMGKEHMQLLIPLRVSSPIISDYHCSVCDVRVPNTVGDIQSHNKSVSHNAKKLTNALDNVCTVNSSYFYVYTMLETQSPGLVSCSVCDILVPKEEKLVINHIESGSHLKKYDELLQDNQLELKIDNIYCNICKVYVGLKSEIMHVRGKRHLKNFSKAKNNPNISLSVEDNAKLEAQVKVKASGLIFNEDDLNVIINNFAISDNLKELICNTCKVNVPFTTYNSRGHLGGSKHKQKLIDLEIMNSENTSAS